MKDRAASQGDNLNIELDELYGLCPPITKRDSNSPRFKIRFKVLADQQDLRELHFKSMVRYKDAEIAHLAAKHEVERRRADTEATRCRTLTAQVSTFSQTESELRSQLNVYVEKFKQVRDHLPTLLRSRPAAQLSPFAHPQQVEDTLNNSNELFLTFRKEMEEMSKKTKRLEKENLSLTRKHDQTNRNILEMAEERTRDKADLQKLHRQETKMRSIIQSMQEQGRGNAQDIPPEIDEEGTESDYEDEYEDDEEEEDDDEEDDEDDGEDETGDSIGTGQELSEAKSKPVFGPVPPPAISESKARTNVNGIKR